jgi:hypothetical protein
LKKPPRFADNAAASLHRPVTIAVRRDAFSQMPESGDLNSPVTKYETADGGVIRRSSTTKVLA